MKISSLEKSKFVLPFCAFILTCISLTKYNSSFAEGDAKTCTPKPKNICLIIRTKSGSTEYPGVFNFKEKK
ncbi:MAG: hypothetical protein RL045_1720 [Bacteroidota bacterium]|jgi:hypothetical protein